MRVLKVKGHTVELFDSIKELTIDRHHEFQKLALLDIGVGSDINSVGSHFSNFHQLLINKKSDQALLEARNLHNNFFYMLQKINVKSFCFHAFIKTIDRKPIKDFSEEGIKANIKRMSWFGLLQSEVEDILEDIKKKLTQNFEPIFLINLENQALTTSTQKSKRKPRPIYKSRLQTLMNKIIKLRKQEK